MQITLTDREVDVMEILWEHGPSTVTEVRERLQDELAYTTVLTMLRILESKGYVGHDSEGRSHRYHALVERDSARSSALKALSRKLFRGSTELLLTHLVTDEKLTPAQLSRIKKLLDERTKKR
jgi:predicted transcriptional regulator